MCPSRLLLLPVMLVGIFFPPLSEQHCAAASAQLKQRNKSLLDCVVFLLGEFSSNCFMAIQQHLELRAALVGAGVG